MNRLVNNTVRTALDVAVLVFSFAVAYGLRFEFAVPQDQLQRMLVSLPYVVVLQYAALVWMGVPKFSWRYFGLREAWRVGAAIGAASAVLLVLRFVTPLLADRFPNARFALVPISVIVGNAVFVFVGLTGMRALRRMTGERSDASGFRRPVSRKATLLVGAGEAGRIVAREVASRPDLGIEAVGFLDDDRQNLGTVIHGVPVLGRTERLLDFAKEYDAEQVLITIADAPGRDARS